MTTRPEGGPRPLHSPMRTRPVFFCCCFLLLGGCHSQPTAPVTPLQLVALFPGIRVDAKARTIEFDGTVCIDASHAPQPEGVPLEALIVTPMSGKEHEALIVTKVKPSDIHAALLLCGAEPGSPGSFRFDAARKKMVPVSPAGPLVTATVSTDKGSEVPLESWVVRASGKAFLPKDHARGVWHFGGSRFANFQGREVYDADMTGVLLGLCTFGGEVLSWPDVLNPDSAFDEPDYFARGSQIPAFGTPINVQLHVE